MKSNFFCRLKVKYPTDVVKGKKVLDPESVPTFGLDLDPDPRPDQYVRQTQGSGSESLSTLIVFGKNTP